MPSSTCARCSSAVPKGASDVSVFAEKRQQRTSSQRHSSRHCTCLRRKHRTKRLELSQHCGGMLRAGAGRRGFHGACQGHLKLRSRPGLLAWVLPYGLLFFLRLPCECQRHHVRHSKAPSADAAELRRAREGRQRGRASGNRVSDTDATAERGDSQRTSVSEKAEPPVAHNVPGRARRQRTMRFPRSGLCLRDSVRT
jgi:hypothetical protein